MAQHWDVIIIGTGAGGGTLAWRLAATGKRILMLERGGFLPRERENWDAHAVFVDERYRAGETWHGGDGRAFEPGIHYCVGGNTKVYGAALFRLRREDFGEIRHHGGISPAWPLDYDDFEPYYSAAEQLYHVHGEHGIDPTEPPASRPYPHPPVSHEPAIQRIHDRMVAYGCHPFPLPLGILLDEHDGRPAYDSACVRCDAFDGFPCLVRGKADAQVICVEPALRHPNVTLRTHRRVTRLETDASGRSVACVHAEHGRELEEYSADIVVVACGAINSAVLLLRSASERHPHGLANGSGLAGRHYMRHNNSALLAISREANPTVFQKTLGLNDFYFGTSEWRWPMGHMQMLGKSHGASIKGQMPAPAALLPDMPFDKLAAHAVDFWLTSEDLPAPENRVTLDADGGIVLHLHENNMEAHRRLRAELQKMLPAIDCHAHVFDRSIYLGRDIPIGGTAHQCGTLRFGTDPATSVLDVDCKAHELDNLYVVDASFFVSSGAVNPSLTIIANALRVGERLAERIT
jgi:choline dehydrogenase-like flavoprotein